MKIAFIGGGNMGEAIIKAVISRGLSLPQEITVSDISEPRLNYLKRKYKIKVKPDNLIAATDAEVIVLAVKPQTLPAILVELKGKLKVKQLVLSIIAGTTVNRVAVGLNHKRIVRSMPNMPAQIGEGMTVWTAAPEVTGRQKKQSKAILGVMGQELFVEDEKFLDMATAISGSGPAYVFYFVEALTEAAVKIGWEPELAEKLALQTLIGAASLLQQSGEKPPDLRKAVTSPGGTTAAAIEQFDKSEYKILIARAVAAAFQRAKELGK